jgi:hypothetical protein
MGIDKRIVNLIQGGSGSIESNIRPIIEMYIKEVRPDIYNELKRLGEYFHIQYNLGNYSSIDIEFEAHESRDMTYGQVLTISGNREYIQEQLRILKGVKSVLASIEIGELKFSSSSKISGSIKYEL